MNAQTALEDIVETLASIAETVQRLHELSHEGTKLPIVIAVDYLNQAARLLQHLNPQK